MGGQTALSFAHLIRYKSGGQESVALACRTQAFYIASHVGRADAFPARHYLTSMQGNKKMLPLLVKIGGGIQYFQYRCLGMSGRKSICPTYGNERMQRSVAVRVRQKEGQVM